MAGKNTPDEELIAALRWRERSDSDAAAARAAGMNRATFTRHLRQARAKFGENYKSALATATKSNVVLPEFPDEDIPVQDVIDLMAKRFEKRAKSYEAHTWFPITVRDKKPIGVLWFGDPHVDDNGCNWPALQRHAELCSTVDGLYGANIGDSTNNWAGRLIRLYADQDTSVKTARRLAKWLMLDSGVKWLVWLLGNHDTWGDGAEILGQMARSYGTTKIICHDWEARFRLCFPNGWEARIFAAHDFAGSSIWNPLHGPMREGQKGAEADLYVCGHKHNYGIFEFENASRGLVQHFIRCRGYKFFDDHARRLGKAEQSKGCSILTIFNPQRQSIKVFSDVEDGVEFLKAKRA